MCFPQATPYEKKRIIIMENNVLESLSGKSLKEAIESMNYVPTLKHLKAVVNKTVSSILDDGDVMPLKAWGMLTALEKFCADVKRQIKDAACDEALDYGPGEFTSEGCRYELRRGGVKYDYTVNPDWNELQSQQDALRGRQKALETRIKKECPCQYTTSLVVHLEDE